MSTPSKGWINVATCILIKTIAWIKTTLISCVQGINAWSWSGIWDFFNLFLYHCTQLKHNWQWSNRSMMFLRLLKLQLTRLLISNRAAHEAGAATAIVNLGVTRADDIVPLKINARLGEVKSSETNLGTIFFTLSCLGFIDPCYGLKSSETNLGTIFFTLSCFGFIDPCYGLSWAITDIA